MELVGPSKLAALVLVAATSTVSSAAAPSTPYLVNVGTTPSTTMMRQCGSQMWAVGKFSSIGSPGHSAVTRNNVVAFDQATGAVAAVDPNVNGQVNTITFSPDCTSAYIGGKFTAVGTTAVKNIAKISTSTGLVDPAFGHNSSGQVSALLFIKGHLLTGGFFATINGSTGSTSSYLTSLSPTTGKSDGYADNLGITGTLPKDVTHIYKMFANPAGTRVAIDGVFTSVLGQTRRQAFVLDLGASSVSMDAWYAPVLNEACGAGGEQFYAKGLGWSPDGNFLYIASTGFRGATLCDAMAKFSASASSNQQLIWINKTGGDSLYSVVATATDVYVGGHNRWLNNPQGVDSCGPGCVPRPGVGDIDPTTGLATAWNPTKTRGHGVLDLFLDSLGNLWVSSDAASPGKCAGAFHPGICEFPHS